MDTTTPQESLAEHKPEPRRNELGQVIASTEPRGGRAQSPFSTLPPIASEWQSQAEAYLADNGWEQVSTGVWRDPVSAGDSRGTRVQVGSLPKPNSPGVVEPLVQMVVPVSRWDRTTEEALQLQRMRDVAGKSEDSVSTLERIDRLSSKVTNLTDASNRIATLLNAGINRPMPEKPENVRAELTRLRREVQAAVAQLRAVNQPSAAVA